MARSLILQINCVVKLTQQMPTEDLQYLQLLERPCHGHCNYDDYELLLTKVIGQPSIGSLRALCLEQFLQFLSCIGSYSCISK